ncbi:hypothetical protein BDV18DRAFT_120265 [Aspergillus unguis]
MSSFSYVSTEYSEYIMTTSAHPTLPSMCTVRQASGQIWPGAATAADPGFYPEFISIPHSALILASSAVAYGYLLWDVPEYGLKSSNECRNYQMPGTR